MRNCFLCEFRERRESASGFSEKMIVDLCGKLLDDGADRRDAVIVGMKECPVVGVGDSGAGES